MRRWIARSSTWWIRLFVLLVAAWPLLGPPFWLQVGAMIVAFGFASVRAPWDRVRRPVTVAPPVRGRWVALNSPATKVPSHGIRSYGQTYAIDVLHPRPPGTSTTIGWGLGMRPPDEFSAFGEPVHAVADGVVAIAHDRQRDHRSRTSWPSLLHLMTIEGLMRELGGIRFMIGNHVVIDHGSGVFSAYGHLRRDSLRVSVGDRVHTGQPIGEVGNSGNSSEPHLHVQLMDDATATAAAGLPFRWNDITIEPDIDPTITKDPPTEPVAGLPANGQIFSYRGTDGWGGRRASSL